MEKHWIDYVVAVGSVLTPILVLLLSGIGWHIKNKIDISKNKDALSTERIKELEDKLRTDRIETYNQLLEPFFMLLTTDAVFLKDPKYKGKDKNQLSIGTMLTVEYRKVGYKLSLIADDSVVRSYNNLMQFFYSLNQDGNVEEKILIHTSQWIKLLSVLMLEIRKSMGNQHTALNNWEMIEWFMSDAHAIKKLNTEYAQL